MSELFIKLSDPSGLAILDYCRYEDGRSLLITRVNVPVAHRRKGAGTSLMNQICLHADNLRVPLYLEVSSYEEESGMDNDQLTEWYGKFGFREIMTRVMRRKPAPLPPVPL